MTPKQLEEAEMHFAMRLEHWKERVPQMLENIRHQPYWQFRAMGVPSDPSDCAAISGRIERFDSRFWEVHHPMHCKRLDCRCTIRAYAHADLVEKGLECPLGKEEHQSV